MGCVQEARIRLRNRGTFAIVNEDTIGSMKKTVIIIAVLIMVGGGAWLLNNLGVLPQVDWMWTGWTGVCGLLILVLGGMNKVSIVLGPFLLVVSVVSVFHRTGAIPDKVQIPALVIVFGALLLLAVLLPVPIPKCLDERLVEKKGE